MKFNKVIRHKRRAAGAFTYFWLKMPVEQNIPAFDISVDDVVGVQVAKASGCAQGYVCSDCPCQRFGS